MEIENSLVATLDCNAMGDGALTHFLREAKFPSRNPSTPFSEEDSCLDNSNETILFALTEQLFAPNRVACYFRPPVHGVLRLNHYWTKSVDEFVEKRSRGFADQYNSQLISKLLGRLKSDVTRARDVIKMIRPLTGQFR
jgi:hypothetical protein